MIQSISGMTINDATDAFTTAFKISVAYTLGIPSTAIIGVTYTQTRRQLLAGVTVNYVINHLSGIPSANYVGNLKTAISTGNFGKFLSNVSGITSLGEEQFEF